MPHIDNALVGYVGGNYVYLRPSWVIDEGWYSEAEAYTPFATSFVPDWKVDEDPRLVASYVGTAEDRDNDREAAIVNDVLTSKSGIVPEDKQYAEVYGYDLLPYPGHAVRCWYCREEFSYRECTSQRRTERANMEAFVTEMLAHYSEHRAGTVIPGEADKPFVTTFFPGRTIRRPDGSVAAQKPGVVRTWQIKGALLGSYS